MGLHSTLYNNCTYCKFDIQITKIHTKQASLNGAKHHSITIFYNFWTNRDKQELLDLSFFVHSCSKAEFAEEGTFFANGFSSLITFVNKKVGNRIN